jgi:peptidoglycan/LPS O-acetylase OafA/YrhL
VRFNQTFASVWLDGLRGIAALMVLLQHWRYLFFCELHSIHRYRPIYAVPYVLTSAGHGAVVLFFVLSGYLVGGSALRTFRHPGSAWRSYMTHRLARLWVVLLPALSIGALWDFLTGGREIAAHTSFKLFFANLFFLQGDKFPTFGSNSPLWSLSYEFWYYIFFPLGLCVVLSAYRPAMRLVAFAGLVAALGFVGHFLGPTVLMLFPAWLAGVILHFIPSRSLSSSVRWIAAVVYGVCFAGAVPFKLSHPLAADLALAAATAVFLWILLCDLRVADQHTVTVRAARSSARFSYTLYLVHTPLLVFLASRLDRDANWYPDAFHLSMGLGILLGVAAYAWLLAEITEFRTDDVRHWFEQRLERKN